MVQLMTQTVVWGNPTAQWGTVTGGVWTTLAFGNGIFGAVNPTANTDLGMIFDGPNLQFSGTRVVDNPVVSGITLRLPLLAAAFNSPRVVRLWAQLVTDAADFSTASAPLTRGETDLGTFTIVVDNFLTPVYQDLVISAASVTQIRALVTSRALWQGRIAFVLEDVTGDGTVGFLVANGPTTPLVLSVEQDLFYAGLTGGPSGGDVRAVRDGRYGMPAWNTELVRDGDNPGLFVRAFDADPEDPEATYRPKPGEGTVDDSIPNL